MSITREELVGAFTPASFRFQREKRGNGGGDDADMRVPPVGEGRRERGYRFGIWLGGLRAASGVGPDRFPGVQFYFFIFIFLSFFSFSVFFISFKHFSNLIQIDPNQLCKVSKIQSNHTEQ
jgi:hypothetical protein